jgi:hypothetical protein
VAAEVRVPAETLRRPGGRLEDTVDVAILAVDVGRSKVTRSTHQTVDVTVPVSRVNSEGEVTYQVVLGLDLPPASYQLRVSARSARADRAGSVYLTIVVPNVSDARLAIVGPTIGFGPGMRPAAGVSLVEDGLLPPGLDPVLDRVFTAGDVLRVNYQVWRRDQRASVTTGVEILNERGALVWTAGAIGETPSGAYEIGMPLAGLSPGGYRVRITAESGQHSAAQELGFAVRGDR